MAGHVLAKDETGVRFSLTAHSETSRSERTEERRAEGARGGKKGRRVATKSEGDGTGEVGGFVTNRMVRSDFLDEGSNFIEIAG